MREQEKPTCVSRTEVNGHGAVRTRTARRGGAAVTKDSLGAEMDEYSCNVGKSRFVTARLRWVRGWVHELSQSVQTHPRPGVILQLHQF